MELCIDLCKYSVHIVCSCLGRLCRDVTQVEVLLTTKFFYAELFFLLPNGLLPNIKMGIALRNLMLAGTMKSFTYIFKSCTGLYRNLT